MERTITTERLYPLGQYTNIKFADQIINLPDSVIFDVELSSKIRYLQMLEVELAYRAYVNLMKQAETKTEEEVAKFLEEQNANTVKEIADKLYKKEYK